MNRKRTLALMAGAGLFALAGTALSFAASDFGQGVERDLNSGRSTLFGFRGGLESSTTDLSSPSITANPQSIGTFAHGLQARVINGTTTPPNIDMLSLWPNDSAPTHLIACNEEGTGQVGLVRINIASGLVETIVTGTTACDGTRRTPWGTIIFNEEAGGGVSGGRVYELIDPLNTTGVSLNRTTGVFSGGTGAANLAVRASLGRLSFEGMAVYKNGVTYYGDENRPSSGIPGGAYFKFIPNTPRAINAGPIAVLSDSPLVAGDIYGLRLGKRNGNTDYGQGSEVGLGTWIPVCADAACVDIDLRAQTTSLKLTGYYRPEDIDIDRNAEAVGNVRFCAPITGNEATDHNWGSVICITDGALADAVANTAVPEVQTLVMGDPAFAMPDNIAFQPGRSNWLVMEDGDSETTLHNNDIWSCMDDGQDSNLLSDGCIRAATLNDLTAEWTGGIFDSTGKRFFVSVQHPKTGHAVVFEVTGWK